MRLAQQQRQNVLGLGDGVAKSLVDPAQTLTAGACLGSQAWHVIDNKVDVSGTLPSFNVEITFGAEAKDCIG